MMITIDNDFRALIPSLSTEEYAQLEANILQDGIRDALVTWNGILLDGHNRYEIAERHGLEYETQEMNFDSRADAERWIILNQFGRRNLSAYDRSVLALKLKPLLAAKAKEKEYERKTGTLQKSAKSFAIDTRQEIAKAAGVSHDTIAKVEKIQQSAPEEVKAAVKSGEMSINQAYKTVKREEEREARQAAIQEQMTAPKSGAHIDIYTTDKRYRVIYADPPWQYNDKQDTSRLGGAVKHYPTMPLEDICALPVPADKNAVLFLWTTSPMLEDAFNVVHAWGFSYKSSFIWDKISHAMGHYNSVRHEFLLVCVRGKCTPDVPKLMDSVVSIERTEHSRKPQEFRAMIDTLYPLGARLEMFAREAPEGWDVWGNMA